MPSKEDFFKIRDRLQDLVGSLATSGKVDQLDLPNRLKNIAEECGELIGSVDAYRIGDYYKYCNDILEQCNNKLDLVLAKQAKTLLGLISECRKLFKPPKTDIQEGSGKLTKSTKSTWSKGKSQCVLFDGKQLPGDDKMHWYKLHIAIQAFTNKVRNGVNIVDAGLYGKSERVPLYKDPNETCMLGKQLLNIYLDDPSQGTSCHPTAIGLRRLMGEGKTRKKVGGAGKANRKEAILCAEKALDDPSHLYVIQLECTATADGHSFSLLMNYDGTVSVLEAWAIPGHKKASVTLPQAWKYRKNDGKERYLSLKETKGYLELLLSDDVKKRDIGYGSLSAAYEDPSLGFEKKNSKERDDREKHSIIVTLAKLRRYEDVAARLKARLDKLEEILKHN